MDAPAQKEPEWTIYRETFIQARRQLQARGGELETAGFFSYVLDTIETGWGYVRPLQLVFDADRERMRMDDEVGALLRYAEVEIVDGFRWLATATAGCVPDLGKCAKDLPLDELESESEVFLRDVRVLGLAAAHPSIPISYRQLLLPATEQLLPWCRRFLVLVQGVCTVLGRKRERGAIAAEPALA